MIVEMLNTIISLLNSFIGCSILGNKEGFMSIFVYFILVCLFINLLGCYLLREDCFFPLKNQKELYLLVIT
jgi:hypothetical protein